MKKIQLQAFVNEAKFNKVMFNVIEQTSRGRCFGTLGSNKFYASNGIVLGSNKNPARDADDKNVIWLRGADMTKDNNTVVVGITRWKKVVAAIKEYNEYFARRAAPAPAPRNQCAVVIG